MAGSTGFFLPRRFAPPPEPAALTDGPFGAFSAIHGYAARHGPSS